MGRRLLLCLVFLAHCAAAQNAYFNSEDFWRRLKLVPEGSIHQECVVLATNRRMAAGALRFALEEREPGKVRFFLVAPRDSNWLLEPVPSLRAALQRTRPSAKDWVVYTEGFGKIFTSGIFRAVSLHEQHLVNVLYLDYPSYNSRKKVLGNFRFVLHNAQAAGEDFAPVIDSLYRCRQEGWLPGRLSFFFHSMGNHVLRRWMKDGLLLQSNQASWVDNLVLNAPCVPQRHHCRWLSCARLARHCYVLYNPRDRNLSGAHLISFRKMLGEKVRKPLSPDATYLNVHSVAGKRHSNFTRLPDHPPVIPLLMQQYSLLLHGETLPLTDSLRYRPSVYRHIGYDLLPADTTQ